MYKKSFIIAAVLSSLLGFHIGYADTATPTAPVTQPIVTSPSMTSTSPTTPSQCTQCCKNHCHSHHCWYQNLSDTLNLTDAQKTQMKMIQDVAHARMKTEWMKMKGLQQGMHDLIQTPILDQDKMNALIQQKLAIKAEIMKIKITMKHDFYQLLNPTQKAQLQEMMNSSHH